MPKQVVWTDRLMRPIAHFSHAVRVDGLVQVGATAGTDAALQLAGNQPGRQDIAAQSERMFDNLDLALSLLGARRDQVVQLKAYVADLHGFAAYRAAFARRFGERPLAHAVVASWGFPLPQAAIEVEATALLEPAPQSWHVAVPSVTDVPFATQAAEALDRMGASLAVAGRSLADICQLQVTLADPRDLPALEALCAARLTPPYPVRSVVAAPLECPGQALLLEAMAMPGGGVPVAAAGVPVPVAASAAV